MQQGSRRRRRHGPGADRAWYTVGVLFIAVIFSFVDRIILSLLVEPIKADLGLTDTDFAWLLGVAFAVFFALSSACRSGRWADRYSRRLIIVIGISLWSVMTVACGLAGNFWELFFARVGVAVGEAALAPAAFSMISDLFPREKLGRALGVYQAGAFIGAGVALLVGGIVIGVITTSGVHVCAVVGEVQPWQIVFFVVGLPGLLVALLMTTVPEPVRRGRLRGHSAGHDPRRSRPVRRGTLARVRPHLHRFRAACQCPSPRRSPGRPVYFARVLHYSRRRKPD